MGTALNALKMLDYFSNARPEIGLSHIARLSGLNKATALRHLRALEEYGLIEQNPMTKSYAIGPAALRLAALREIARPGIESARQKMQVAMQSVGESLHLSLLEKTVLQTALVVETTRHSVRVSLDPSEILPINATASGLCMLSFGPTSLMDRLDQDEQVRFTDATLTDPDIIKERVAQISVSGWANSSGSYEEGVFGYAAPIFGINQVALGTIAIAVPEGRATDDRLPSILSALHALSTDLTADFGGQLPDTFPTEFHP
ncbi:IclR family transcriptional regulator [Ruegeria sp. 6PALISEP08]|uniref:IclR family transcriptional regulator n=1 Tax=Ruegeria sp. 6PALISEP08 TaxID=1225660 RepID=UPI0009F95720|nr:IclR family transcriptional regulator [Ruegeria sp. 6PALISEP08]